MACKCARRVLAAPLSPSSPTVTGVHPDEKVGVEARDLGRVVHEVGLRVDEHVIIGEHRLWMITKPAIPRFVPVSLLRVENRGDLVTMPRERQIAERNSDELNSRLKQATPMRLCEQKRFSCRIAVHNETIVELEQIEQIIEIQIVWPRESSPLAATNIEQRGDENGRLKMSNICL